MAEQALNESTPPVNPELEPVEAVAPVTGPELPVDEEEPDPVDTGWVAGDALTARPQDISQTRIGQTAEIERQKAAATVAELQEADARSSWDVIKAGVAEWDSAYIFRKMQENIELQWQDYDPDFDVVTAANELIQTYHLPNTEQVREYLYSAGTQEEAHYRAEQYQKHMENMRILGQHGVTAFAVGMLDPVWVLSGIGTFGASRALQLGRVGTGALMGTEAAGMTALAENTQIRETTALDYALNIGLSTGLGMIFGSPAAQRIVRGEDTTYGTITKHAPGTRPLPEGQAGAAGQLGERSWLNEHLSEFDRLAMPGREGEAVRAQLIGRLVDDPVRRSGYMHTIPATSWLRRYRNEIDPLNQAYTDAVQDVMREQGYGWVARNVDPTGEYTAARAGLERRVAAELVRRENNYRAGLPVQDSADPHIKLLVDRLEALHGRVGELARDAGLRGFEDFVPTPGYFHRSWNSAKMARYAPEDMQRLLTQAAMRGMPGIDEATATAMARAVIDRAHARLRDEGLDFFGSLGKADTDMIEQMLRDADLDETTLKSVMSRMTQSLSERGQVSYSKSRIPFDMTTSIRTADGTSISMLDLIDTDLGRLAENYTSAMTGRSALAKAGLGGSDDQIAAFRREYMDSISHLDEVTRRDRRITLDGLLGDFTGIRPESNILSLGFQRAKGLADATLLGASGLWQVNQYAHIAHRYGVARTTAEFFKSAPGVRKLLRQAQSNADLKDELAAVMGLDLSRDIRWHPYMRQHDVNQMAKDTLLDRLIHTGKQAVPMLNAMKYVHRNQTRMNANLAINTLARATAGDAKALRILEAYGLKGEGYARVAEVARGKDGKGGIVRYNGKNAAEMNWAAWPQDAQDLAMDVVLRMMDDAVMYARPGQTLGTRLMARSAGGQILGQFTSWVGGAHNKLLRGTIHNEGYTGLALLLAFELPLSAMMVAVNETLKGRDVTPEKLAWKAVGYAGGLGLATEAVNVVGAAFVGSPAGRGAPILAPFQRGSQAAGGVRKVINGDYRDGSLDITEAALMTVPGVAILPGLALAIDAARED